MMNCGNGSNCRMYLSTQTLTLSIVELGTIASKHLLFLIAVGFSLVTLFSVSRRLTPIHEPPIAAGRRVRWRPLLRAPPHPL